MPVLTLFRPRCVWSKGKAMGQSVQLLMVTLGPGSERGVGAGDVARAAGRGRREMWWGERAVLGPPGSPRGGGWQMGLGVCAQLRTLAGGRGCSLEPLGRGVGAPQELHSAGLGLARSATRRPAAEKG